MLEDVTLQCILLWYNHIPYEHNVYEYIGTLTAFFPDGLSTISMSPPYKNKFVSKNLNYKYMSANN